MEIQEIENNNLFNYLKRYNLNKKIIEKANNYCKTLTCSTSKEAFFNSCYLYKKIVNYVEKNEIKELKKINYGNIT